MHVFFVTFPQYHPLRDCWIEIEADIESEAREAAVKMFGTRFGFIYTKHNFNREYFPAGRAGRTVTTEEVLG